MTSKQITNAGQAFALGGSWGTPSVDNAGSTNVCYLINDTNQILYPGDIVCIDASGTLAQLPATATLNTVFGTVGNGQILSAYPAASWINDALVVNDFPVQISETPGVGVGYVIGDGAGDLQPPTTSPIDTVFMGFTNGSLTVTYTDANILDVGKYILTPYSSTNNPNPQVFQVVTVTPGTGYTVNVITGGNPTGFSGTTGTFLVQLGTNRTQLGPGWWPALSWNDEWQWPTNAVVPIITDGFGLVNVYDATATVAGDLLEGTDGQVYASPAATNICIATALEPYSARNTNLTFMGITGHEPVRALIGRTSAGTITEPAATTTTTDTTTTTTTPAA